MSPVRRVLLKVSGKLVQEPALLDEFAHALRDLRQDAQFVVVHGGGPAISALLKRLGVQTSFVQGQRVTDEAVLEAAEMVLSGSMNKAIVAALQRAGVKAAGLSGRDGDLIQVEPETAFGGELGLVGRVKRVRAELLELLSGAGYVPVVSPISSGPEKRAYNVNADWASAQVAAGWKADALLYFGDTDGVLRDGERVPLLTPALAEEMFRTGQAGSGMIPKIESAFWALDHGVGFARILRWEGPQGLSAALSPDDLATGTLIRKREETANATGD
ncbi:MAG TPA: acetylglutamate kinase [Bacteroidetes bacterium]|nr:acetylglutamate kinase [Bacteroidota bacterium]